jgi:hypothetical protein
MSRGLQVIIGIGVVVVVAAVVFATLGPLLLPQLRVALPANAGQPGFYNRPQGGPVFPFRQGRPFGPRMPFFGFFGLFGLARLAGPLLIGALIVLALILLLRRPPAVVMTAPLPPSPVAPASQMVCSQCGQPLQAGWKHCPNCGAPTMA